MMVKAYELKPPGEDRSIHITSLLHHPGERKLFLGLTDHKKNDLLFSFNWRTSSFESCGFTRIADKYDVKIHRSLILDDADGSIIGATAGLHDVPERQKAKGGKIFRYFPSDGTLDLIAEPVERDYIQSILYDGERRIIYGFTYPVGYFFRYLLDSDDVRSLYIGSYPHLSTLDDDGGVWGTWGNSNSLFRYDPGDDEITWHKTKIPRLSVSPLAATSDTGQVDCMLNCGDGFIYIGSVSGGLFRLEPHEVTVEYLGKPLVGLRMSAMTMGENGLIYAVGGMGEGTRFFSYDRNNDQFRIHGQVRDVDIGQCPYITHHVVSTGSGTFYSGETDNPERSGYLWEIKTD